jgi:indolepyruvate ferredoxin oxidoreductase
VKRPQTSDFVGATELATALMGDAIATNMFMLGYAYQKGWVPLAGESLERAIELNGVAVEFNRKSFLWGRRAAADQEKVKRIATPADVIPIDQHFSRNLDELIERRAKFLADYQNAAYADNTERLVDRVRRIEQEKAGSSKLAEAVARYYHKLLAYKDEYEVARLHANGEFEQEDRGHVRGRVQDVLLPRAPALSRKPIRSPASRARCVSDLGSCRLQGSQEFSSSSEARRSILSGAPKKRRMERELIRTTSRRSSSCSPA